jgi:5-(carboxyamino)imidazole ribonucleotide synthase
MLAESLLRLDAEVVVLEPDPESPARRRMRDVIVANNPAELAARVDLVTYEFENIDAAPLRPLEAGGTRFLPSVTVLETSQDRIREKRFLDGTGLPCARWQALGPDDDLAAAARAFGLPCILKTARGGYDGKGQHALSHEADLAPLASLPRANFGWVLEERVDIAAELSCIVARAVDGSEVAFPVFENRHRDHVLDFTLLPAPIAPEIAARAVEIARTVAEKLAVVGLITVEFFLDRGGKLHVNELAPRPHNSGHVTRQACTLSQFDALARVLTGAPLTQPELLAPGAFCMANLLGEVWLAQGREELDLSAWSRHPHVLDVYLYGKRDARPKRKMGHLVAWGQNADAALSAARSFRDELSRSS